MNYKKMGIIGTLCAMGALAPQKAKADYIIEEPIYTTESIVYETVPSYTQQPIVYETAPVTVIQQQPIVYSTTPVIYNNAAYYDGYYDAMNRRWWYNNTWTYRRPPVHRPHHGYGAPRFNRCAPAPRLNHCAPVVRPHFNRCAPAPRMNRCAPVARPHFNRCAPAPRMNRCAPVARPHFNRCAPVRINHCAPRGGFHHGGGHRGGRHCR